MANRPYITAARVRYSVIRRRWVEARKREEAELAEQAARRSSRTPKAPKTSTTSAKEA